MEEIKVNEYVRTISGNIDKVDALIGMIENTVHLEKHKWQDIKNIVKHSPNIIDLIEEGDYVNGLRITSREGNTLFISNIEHKILYEPIKNIVTKEMFNQVKYEV